MFFTIFNLYLELLLFLEFSLYFYNQKRIIKMAQTIKIDLNDAIY